MIAKKTGASLAFYALLGSVGALWATGVRFFTPLHFFSQPPEFYAWLAGMTASELCYAMGLRLAYRSLDMSTAYPIMRSIPLILLAVITTVFGFGDPLGKFALAGMGMVFAGCLVLPLNRFSDFAPSRYLDRNFGYILLVALGTTGYTLCDKQAQLVMKAGAEAAGLAVSKPVISLTYYSFRVITLVTVLWIVVFCTRTSRAEAAELWRNRDWRPFVAGCCSSLTYVLVLMAMNYVSNVSFVQAFRQIGLLFGMLEGVFILKERCTAPKVVGLALVLVGLVVSVL
jgi:multidrug transporter EmrE-like cation transporter